MSSSVFPIPTFLVPDTKKKHNNFKDHHFWEHNFTLQKRHPVRFQGGADPTSLRPGLDLAECASTRKICRGGRCWRPGPGWGVGLMSVLLGGLVTGWWGLVGYATWNLWSSCCFEVMEELSQEKRWCFSKVVACFLLGFPRDCIFFLLFSVLYVRCCIC